MKWAAWEEAKKADRVEQEKARHTMVKEKLKTKEQIDHEQQKQDNYARKMKKLDAKQE
jgi:hypothetical protein